MTGRVQDFQLALPDPDLVPLSDRGKRDDSRRSVVRVDHVLRMQIPRYIQRPGEVRSAADVVRVNVCIRYGRDSCPGPCRFIQPWLVVERHVHGDRLVSTDEEVAECRLADAIELDEMIETRWGRQRARH